MFGWLDRLTLRLFLAQGADVATFLAFYLLVGPQVHAERNPLILGLMALGGLAAVGLFKMLITLIVIYRYRRSTTMYPPRRLSCRSGRSPSRQRPHRASSAPASTSGRSSAPVMAGEGGDR